LRIEFPGGLKEEKPLKKLLVINPKARGMGEQRGDAAGCWKVNLSFPWIHPFQFQITSNSSKSRRDGDAAMTVPVGKS